MGAPPTLPHPASPLARCPLEVKSRGRRPRRVGAGRACGGSGRPGGSGLLGRPPARGAARTGAWASLGTGPPRAPLPCPRGEAGVHLTEGHLCESPRFDRRIFGAAGLCGRGELCGRPWETGRERVWGRGRPWVRIWGGFSWDSTIFFFFLIVPRLFRKTLLRLPIANILSSVYVEHFSLFAAGVASGKCLPALGYPTPNATGHVYLNSVLRLLELVTSGWFACMAEVCQ